MTKQFASLTVLRPWHPRTSQRSSWDDYGASLQRAIIQGTLRKGAAHGCDLCWFLALPYRRRSVTRDAVGSVVISAKPSPIQYGAEALATLTTCFCNDMSLVSSCIRLLRLLTVLIEPSCDGEVLRHRNLESYGAGEARRAVPAPLHLVFLHNLHMRLHGFYVGG